MTADARHHYTGGKNKVEVVTQPPLADGELLPATCVVFGSIADGCLVRIHSSCLYGNVFGFSDCDCGLQLRHARTLIEREGSGVLIYLEQEGRGAGLMAKARAYQHREEHGGDTYEAYESLGLKADYRSYDAAAVLLTKLALKRIRLLTNNPEKIDTVRASGIEVKREPLIVPVTGRAVAYLQAKRQHGHLL